MLFDIIEYKDSKITWNEFLEYLEEVKKEEILRNELEIKFRKSDEYKNNKDKYERILRLGNFQFKTIFDNIYNNKIFYNFNKCNSTNKNINYYITKNMFDSNGNLIISKMNDFSKYENLEEYIKKELDKKSVFYICSTVSNYIHYRRYIMNRYFKSYYLNKDIKNLEFIENNLLNKLKDT